MELQQERPEREYWCFISYRRVDNNESGREWATWLHQFLETYEVPEDLVGKINERGEAIPSRIYPVFRDEEELATGDLEQRIYDALDNSRVLVPVCSPRAIESQYVVEEIRYFRHKKGDDFVHPIVIEGDPPASSKEEGQCFPNSLRFELDENGQLDFDCPQLPLAADFRLPNGEQQGWTSPEAYRQQLESEGILGTTADDLVSEFEDRLKQSSLQVVAGILGISAGELAQRDKQYQLELSQNKARILRRWLAAITLLSVLVALGGIAALFQRSVAISQKNANLENLSQVKFEASHQVAEEGNLLKSMFLACKAVEECHPNDLKIPVYMDRVIHLAKHLPNRIVNLRVGADVSSASFSPSFDKVILANKAREVRVYTLPIGKLLPTPSEVMDDGDAMMVCPAFDESGEHAYAVTAWGHPEPWPMDGESGPDGRFGFVHGWESTSGELITQPDNGGDLDELPWVFLPSPGQSEKFQENEPGPNFVWKTFQSNWADNSGFKKSKFNNANLIVDESNEQFHASLDVSGTVTFQAINQQSFQHLILKVSESKILDASFIPSKDLVVTIDQYGKLSAWSYQNRHENWSTNIRNTDYCRFIVDESASAIGLVYELSLIHISEPT